MAYIRGAITTQNTIEDISNSSVLLVDEIMLENKLVVADISAIIFTVTKDINATNPCTAVRKKIGGNCAYLCFAEADIVNALPLCIRVCLIAEKIQQNDAKHVYLRGASCLRTDLIK